MASYNAPRRGSLAFYPRVRVRKETPSIKASSDQAKALSFLGYKVGMIQVSGINSHKNSPSFGQQIVTAATVVECPALKVMGIRAYEKAEIGFNPLTDVLAPNFDKEILRKVNNFKTKSEKNKKADSKKTEEKEYTVDDLHKELKDIEYFTLLVNTQVSKIGFKKTPDITELFIGGNKEEQLKFAKEMIGKEINVEDVFGEGEYLDVKGVTKGKGFQGVIKRFNVKQQRPKAKKRRIVGSISPWHPHTVMWTVPRAGQMGYHNRTEFSKKLGLISTDLDKINGVNGFINYGPVKTKYVLIMGSIPGPAKRCIAFRKSQRPLKIKGVQIQTIEKILIKKK